MGYGKLCFGLLSVSGVLDRQPDGRRKQSGEECAVRDGRADDPLFSKISISIRSRHKQIKNEDPSSFDSSMATLPPKPKRQAYLHWVA